jgi:starch synthase
LTLLFAHSHIKTSVIQILHISTECYPAAKTGGLADVVGALPKYLSKAGVLSAAIIPKYSLKWMNSQEWITVHGGSIRLDWRHVGYSVQQLKDNSLGYPLFVVDIPGLYDRPGIYNDAEGHGYGDEIERYLAFQQAVIQWVISFPEAERPKVLHCHDHHTGLIPFMIKFCPEYRTIQHLATVFTIHNGQYQGWFSWDHHKLLPLYDASGYGYLDYQGVINPMASAIRCAWAVTTVSRSYMQELHQSSVGLESLFHREWQKQIGIINGIDADIWDPSTDTYLDHRFTGDITAFKAIHKKQLCASFGLSEDVPLVAYIGRMVNEKGVDLLPDVFQKYIHLGGAMNFLILGSGGTAIEDRFKALAHQYKGILNCYIGYSEQLSHVIYAGADFLIMPSRVEPCGLNQMYAMRYGTIPIVRSVGGLKDTVPDIGEPDGLGTGIRFDRFDPDDAFQALVRAGHVFYNKEAMTSIRAYIMSIDHSWENSVNQYLHLYRKIGLEA